MLEATSSGAARGAETGAKLTTYLVLSHLSHLLAVVIIQWLIVCAEYVHVVSAGTSSVKVEQAVIPKDERLYW
jgi:hypothetical protein